MFYDDEEIAALIRDGKSILRIGDGEIGILHFNTSDYQKYSDEIRRDFAKIIKNYTDESPYILSIPIFVNYTNRELRDLGPNKLRLWMPLKITYELLFNKRAKYIDAHLFYKDNKFKKIVLPYILTKKFILVTNEDNKKEVLNTSFAKNIFDYVLCPDQSSYENRHEAQANIIKIINQSGLPKKEFVILLAAGMAKTIIYELSLNGYQLFDIGKGIEGYYKDVSLEHLSV